MTPLGQRIFRFGIVGGGITLLNYVLSVALIGLGAHYVLATSFGWFVGVVISFFANKHYTFLQRGQADLREVASFLSGYVLQLLVGTATLVIFIDGIGLPFGLAFCFNVVITALFSYCFMDRIVFTTRRHSA